MAVLSPWVGSAIYHTFMNHHHGYRLVRNLSNRYCFVKYSIYTCIWLLCTWEFGACSKTTASTAGYFSWTCWASGSRKASVYIHTHIHHTRLFLQESTIILNFFFQSFKYSWVFVCSTKSLIGACCFGCHCWFISFIDGLCFVFFVQERWQELSQRPIVFHRILVLWSSSSTVYPVYGDCTKYGSERLKQNKKDLFVFMLLPLAYYSFF